MNLSKEDMFCEAQTTSTTATGSTNTLDFHSHGDDILHQLFWSLWVKTASNGCTLTVAWETSSKEDFSSDVTTLFTKTIAATDLTAGAYPIKNEVLPRGLKRYNRLKFTAGSGTTAPTVTAFLHDGRVEGQPLQGV